MIRACACIVALTACGGDIGGDDVVGGGSDGGGSGDAAHNACISETNRLRTMSSRAAVAQSPALQAYADVGAEHDFSTSPHDHFVTTQGGGIAFAENECPQQGNWQLPAGGDMAALVVDCIAAFYSEGPGGGHYDNMMGPYATLGCGIYQSGTKVTIIQDFGN